MALIDDVSVKIKAGNGGDGSTKFGGIRKGVRIQPSGGDGGNGGSVYLISSHNLSDLSSFRYKKIIRALDGGKGMPKNHSGKNALDLEIFLPIGTQVLDENGSVANLTQDNQKILIARGGSGGIGSYRGRREGYDDQKFKAELGEERELRLVLSLIADVGLVGLPNAGKSSLLAVLTAANPKIGDYPFTTLEPNIGMMGKIVLADIPGLIEGASQGIGLGTKFLKHIQKTRILLHCIEATNPDPIKSYKVVRGEFEKFNQQLLEKKEIILLTKKDLINKSELERMANALGKFASEVLLISIKDEDSIQNLRVKIENLISLS